MKLFELRQFLKTYEQTWYMRKLVSGAHEEAKSIRLYLQEFDNRSADYQFTESDIFKLLQRIPLHSNLEIITSIKNKLGSTTFFEFFAGLRSAGLVNERTFPMFYCLTDEGQEFLHSLFCGSPAERITISAEVFAATMAMTFRMNYSRKILEQCLKLLNSKKLLTPAALELLTHHAAEAILLFDVLEELVQANCLNATTLGYLTGKNYVSLHTVSKILNVLNRAIIVVDDALVKAICAADNLNFLIDTLDTLIATEDKFLNNGYVVMLLQQSIEFFISKQSIFQLLQQHAMLDKKRFDFVCTQDVFAFGQILKIVAAKLPLKNNQELLDHLVNQRVNAYRLYQVIRYLNKTNLLDQTSVNQSVQLLLSMPKKQLFSKDIIDLFDLLFDFDIPIKKENLSLFFNFKTNAPRLHKIVSDLHTNKLLDPDSFEKACERVTKKIPKMPESAVVKHCRKQTKYERSELVIDNATHVYAEHNTRLQYASGGYGMVKKGYVTAEVATPSYSIKKLNESGKTTAPMAAAREVKYHRLLGRNAFYFSMKGKTRIISQWLSEKEMHLFTVDELQNTPVEARLRCLKNGLSDLNTLHQNYRVHGDIKPSNFIVDLNNATMKLIDFGTTHKRGSPKDFAHTKEYCDPFSNGDHFYKDLYAMGIVTAKLFPESLSTPLSIWEQAITRLISSMMHPQGNARCTSADALAYCESLLVNFNNLNTAKLDEIANASIYRNHITPEDILREKISVNYSP